MSMLRVTPPELEEVRSGNLVLLTLVSIVCVNGTGTPRYDVTACLPAPLSAPARAGYDTSRRYIVVPRCRGKMFRCTQLPVPELHIM